MDVVVIAAGLVVYSIILYFHEYVSGVQIVEKDNLFFFILGILQLVLFSYFVLIYS